MNGSLILVTCLLFLILRLHSVLEFIMIHISCSSWVESKWPLESDFCEWKIHQGVFNPVGAILSVIYWRRWEAFPEAAAASRIAHEYYYWKRGEEDDESKGGWEWNEIISNIGAAKWIWRIICWRVPRALHKHRQCMSKRVADRTPVRGDTDIQMCRERWWWSIGITLDIGDIFSAYYYRHTGYLISLSCLFAVAIPWMNERVYNIHCRGWWQMLGIG